MHPVIPIDLNCDMGEAPEAVFGGAQERIMRHVSSVNIACGGHAGDAATMEATVLQALRNGCGIGAHPGYPDPENFGRISMQMDPAALERSIYEQVSALGRIAAACGASVGHVKPHGALYNDAARDPALASVIACAVARWRRDVLLVGLAGSQMLDVFRAASFATAAEAFADRAYEDDGSLRPRRLEGALISNASAAAHQALQIAAHGSVTTFGGGEVRVAAQTICIHGDTSGAEDIAKEVCRVLRSAGVQITTMKNSV